MDDIHHSLSDEFEYDEVGAYEQELQEQIDEALDDPSQVDASTDLGNYLRQLQRIPLLNAEQEVELAQRIEAGLFSEEQLAERRKLDRDTRADLEWIAQDGRAARQHLLSANLRLVVWMAHQYQSSTLGLDDLIQEGNIGLMRAVEKFDYTKGYKFSTFAVWWIRQSVVRAIQDKERIIRLPANKQAKVWKLRQARSDIASDLGREASVEELADELGWSADQVEDILKLAHDPESADALDEALERSVLNSVTDPEDDVPNYAVADFTELSDNDDTELLAWRVQNALQLEFQDMSELEVDVLRMRTGLDGEGPRTTADVARALGLPEETVDKISTHVFQRLRRSEILRDALD
jgi:RNA polymerase primary sigma factor